MRFHGVSRERRISLRASSRLQIPEKSESAEKDKDAAQNANITACRILFIEGLRRLYMLITMTRRNLLFGGVALALHQNKIDDALRLVEAKASTGEVAAAAVEVQHGDTVIRKAFGKAKTPDAVFLLASITKPMTCTAAMILSDRKELSIEDPVQKYLPEFKGGGRDRMLVRHLLTHSSGLPDMLPENEDLRKRHAPLKDFVAGTFRTPLLFTPGTQVKYQSMGILLASEIIERITKRPLPDFLREQVYAPLGMRATSLGLGGRRIADTMLCQVPDNTDWNWNSPYWRNLGAPWGGAHSNVGDVTRLLQYFGKPDKRVVKPDTAKAMVTNQNAGLNQPYGIGWALPGPRFGHGGSTGTLCWFDPQKNLSFVLLTTKPAAESQKTVLTPASDLVIEATKS
jgi:CubicO group peptidase (beta-lactamase class C family)